MPRKTKTPRIDLTDLADADTSTAEGLAKQRAKDIIRILIGRKAEALRLFIPLEVQQKFFESTCRVRLVRGANRAGKTLLAAVDVARACTNQDPHKKYPKTGDVYIVSEQWGEIGRVIYPKLFMRGPFKAIRDKETKLWRAYKPWEPADAARVNEAKDAGPLIPKRFVQSIAWHEKKLNQPKLIKLKNGWTIHFFSGDSKPPSGSAIDIAWLDEEIKEAEWFIELNSRIAEREGVLLWTATPEVGTDQFLDYCLKAENQMLLPPNERDVEEYHMTLAQNPHISAKAKEGMASMLSDQDYQVRILGVNASKGRVILPEYSLRKFGLQHFEIPKRWTFYAAVDPGHQMCAVLFGVVPDPSDMVNDPDPFDLLLFDELYIPRCNARKFAQAMKTRVNDTQTDFEDWAIDMHMGRQTEMGSGRTVMEQYSDALAELGISCRRRGSGFAIGDDDVKGSVENIRSYLALDPYSGLPRLRVLMTLDKNKQPQSMLPNFDREILRWKYKVDKGLATDEPETRGNVHLMACLRYLCGMKPKFVPVPYVRNNVALDEFDRLARRAERAANPFDQRVVFGPAAGARR